MKLTRSAKTNSQWSGTPVWASPLCIVLLLAACATPPPATPRRGGGPVTVATPLGGVAVTGATPITSAEVLATPIPIPTIPLTPVPTVGDIIGSYYDLRGEVVLTLSRKAETRTVELAARTEQLSGQLFYIPTDADFSQFTPIDISLSALTADAARETARFEAVFDGLILRVLPGGLGTLPATLERGERYVFRTSGEVVLNEITQTLPFSGELTLVSIEAIDIRLTTILGRRTFDLTFPSTDDDSTIGQDIELELLLTAVPTAS